MEGRGFIDFKISTDTFDIEAEGDEVAFDTIGTSALLTSLFTEKREANINGYWLDVMSSHVWKLYQASKSEENITNLQEYLDEYARNVEEAGWFKEVSVTVEKSERDGRILIMFSVYKEGEGIVKKRAYFE